MRTPLDQELLIVEHFLLIQRHEDLGRHRRQFRVGHADVAFKAAEERLFRLFSRREELCEKRHTG